MYPFVRLAKETWKFRNADTLDVGQEHVSQHICWPWDLDFWVELNNGRTLTLFDLGRIPMASRVGLLAALKRERWGLTVAGVMMQYRRRVRVFEKIEMRSKILCWDARFIYIDQTMWLSDGTCANQAIYRAAVTDKNGIVSTDRVATAMGREEPSPPMPEFVAQWVAAEAQRPWPPENMHT